MTTLRPEWYEIEWVYEDLWMVKPCSSQDVSFAGWYWNFHGGVWEAINFAANLDEKFEFARES
jgi:hypothetical protein